MGKDTNRITFISYIVSNFEEGRLPKELIEEININIENFGELILFSSNENEVSIKPYWLHNLKYEEFVFEAYEKFQKEKQMKKQEVKSKKQDKGLQQDTYFSLSRELHNKNKKVLDLDNQEGLTEMLNSAKNEEKVEKNMNEKKITLRPFAPKGLLTDTQTAQLKAWWSGEKRGVSTRELASIVKVSRQKLYDSFEKNPKRPFDELKLVTVNNLIQLYNKDIQSFKEEQQTEVKESKTNKKRATELIKKVGE